MEVNQSPTTFHTSILAQTGPGRGPALHLPTPAHNAVHLDYVSCFSCFCCRAMHFAQNPFKLLAKPSRCKQKKGNESKQKNKESSTVNKSGRQKQRLSP